MKKIVWTVIVTLTLVIVIPLIVLATGMVNMGASVPPSSLEESLANLAVKRSVATHAPNQPNPFAGDLAAISTGLDHYAAMCVICHGAPGVGSSEFAQGLNPPAPGMKHAVQKFAPAELFWIIKNGIRMTGMPAFGETHSDDDIWKIAAFLDNISDLTPAQQQRLADGRDAPEGHGSHSHESGKHDSSSKENSNEHADHDGGESHEH